MATTVQLKVKDQEGNVRTENHEIEDITFEQFEDLMKLINEIIAEMRQQDSLRDFISEMFSGDVDFENSTNTELLAKLDQEFLMNAVSSFESLSVFMPTKVRKLLSVLSGIDLELIKKQKLLTVMDIYDAIVEENDLEKIINRAKKSLALTTAKMKIKGLFQKATNATKTTSA